MYQYYEYRLNRVMSNKYLSQSKMGQMLFQFNELYIEIILMLKIRKWSMFITLNGNNQISILNKKRKYPRLRCGISAKPLTFSKWNSYHYQRNHSPISLMIHDLKVMFLCREMAQNAPLVKNKKSQKKRQFSQPYCGYAICFTKHPEPRYVCANMAKCK